jgi:hypothetical protein
MSPSSKPHWQIRLRTVLLFVLLIAISAGWYGNRLHNNRLQSQLIESIGKKGGYVWLDVVGPFIDVQFTPSSIDRGCGQVRCLASPNGTTGTFADNDLELIEKLDNLRSIDFSKTNVTADAIVAFWRRHPECRVTSPQ